MLDAKVMVRSKISNFQRILFSVYFHFQIKSCRVSLKFDIIFLFMLAYWLKDFCKKVCYDNEKTTQGKLKINVLAHKRSLKGPPELKINLIWFGIAIWLERYLAFLHNEARSWKGRIFFNLQLNITLRHSIRVCHV